MTLGGWLLEQSILLPDTLISCKKVNNSKQMIVDVP